MTGGPLRERTHAKGLGAAAFRRIMGSLPVGVTVVTARDADGVPKGLTVSACSSVSLDPPLLLVCIDHRSSSLETIKATGTFAVNILHAEQRALAARFASRCEDKFAGVPCVNGKLNLPLLDGSLAYAECVTFKAIEAGDHTILIGLILHGGARDAVPLTYFRRQYGAWSAACPS